MRIHSLSHTQRHTCAHAPLCLSFFLSLPLSPARTTAYSPLTLCSHRHARTHTHELPLSHTHKQTVIPNCCSWAQIGDVYIVIFFKQHNSASSVVLTQTHAHTHTHTHTKYTHTHSHTHTYTHTHIYIYIYIHTHIHIYIYTCIEMYIYICICIPGSP